MSDYLRPGQRVLVFYDPDPNELLWHERLLCAHVRGHHWIVATPDRDIYLEDLEEGIEGMVPLGPMGGLPAGWSRGPTYLFRNSAQGLLSKAESGRLQAEGEELAVAERAGPDAGAPPPLPPPLEAPSAVVAGGVPDLGEGEWRFMESRGGACLGERVPFGLLEAGVCVGDRGVVRSEGVPVSCRFFKAGEQMPTPRRDGAPVDPPAELRTLPVKYETAETRHRSYKEAASLTTTTSFEDWPISGPRTAEWLAREIARQELTPVRRHYWWRQLLSLGPTDWGVGEHEALSRLFEYALTYDQLNFGELASLELAGRRYQLLEEKYARMLVEATAGGDGAHLDNDRLFMGEERRHGRALVAPALESWVSQKLAEESAVLKERRKAMEERQLARSNEVAPAGGRGAEDDKNRPPKRPPKKGGPGGGGN